MGEIVKFPEKDSSEDKIYKNLLDGIGLKKKETFNKEVRRNTNVFACLIGLSWLMLFVVFMYEFGWAPETLFWPSAISLVVGVIWLIAMNGAHALLFYVRKLHAFIYSKF